MMPKNSELVILYACFTCAAAFFALVAVWPFVSDTLARIICAGLAVWSCYLCFFIGKGKAFRDMTSFKYCAHVAKRKHLKKKEDMEAFDDLYFKTVALLRNENSN